MEECRSQQDAPAPVRPVLTQRLSRSNSSSTNDSTSDSSRRLSEDPVTKDSEDIPPLPEDLDDIFDYDDPEVVSYEELERRNNAHIIPESAFVYSLAQLSSRSNSASKNGIKSDSPPIDISKAAAIYQDSVARFTQSFGPGVYPRLFQIWEQATEDFMCDGYLGSWDLTKSGLEFTAVDLERSRKHYDNLDAYLRMQEPSSLSI